MIRLDKLLAHSGYGRRKEVKELVKKLVEMHSNSDINIFNSMFNVNPSTTRNIEK